MFYKKMDFLSFKVPFVSIYIIFIFILIQFFIQGVLLFTLSKKWKNYSSSYNVDSIKICNEFLKVNNKRIFIKLSDYKIFNIKKNVLNIPNKLALDNSMWSQSQNLYITSQTMSRYYKLIILWRVFLPFLEIFSIITLLINNVILNYFGLAIFSSTFLFSIITCFISSSAVKRIELSIFKYMNEEDVKNLKKIYKYNKIFPIFNWFLSIPYLFLDIFNFLKNNGIKNGE